MKRFGLQVARDGGDGGDGGEGGMGGKDRTSVTSVTAKANWGRAKATVDVHVKSERLRHLVSGRTYAQRLQDWKNDPEGSSPPEGVHPIEIQHTLPLLTAIIGLLPAMITAMYTHWSGNVTFRTMDDLDPTNNTKFYAYDHRNHYLLNTPDIFTPEPFAALSNFCYWSCGVGVVMLPGLIGKPLPVGTTGTGIFLALLGVGSLAFHDSASETDTWQHKLDEIFMYGVFGWLAGVGWFSAYSTFTNRVTRARDPLEMVTNLVGMAIVLIIIVRIDVVVKVGNEFLGHFLLVVFSLSIMIANQTCLCSLFWHLQKKNAPHRLRNAMKKSLPTLVVRVLHFQMAFVLQRASFAAFAQANEKIPYSSESSAWNNSVINDEIQQVWHSGVDALFAKANATGRHPEILKIMSRSALVHDFRYVAANYHNTNDNIAYPNFTHTFDERVELRARHDLCHGMWHFHTACVIMGMGMTIVIGTSSQHVDDDFEMPAKIIKWERYSMGIELFIALVNAALEMPEGGSSSNTHLVFVAILVSVLLPTMVYIMWRIFGLGWNPCETWALIAKSPLRGLRRMGAKKAAVVAAPPKETYKTKARRQTQQLSLVTMLATAAVEKDQQAARNFAALDTNNDGVLSLEELDTNKDGVLTVEDFTPGFGETAALLDLAAQQKTAAKASAFASDAAGIDDEFDL